MPTREDATMYFKYSAHPKAGDTTTRKRTSPNPNISSRRLCLTFAYAKSVNPTISISSKFPKVRIATHFQPSVIPMNIRLRIPKVRSHQEDTVRLLISEIVKMLSGIKRDNDNHLAISPSHSPVIFCFGQSPRH